MNGASGVQSGIGVVLKVEPSPLTTKRRAKLVADSGLGSAPWSAFSDAGSSGVKSKIAPKTNAQLAARLKAVVPRAISPAPVFIDHAKNSEWWDVEGKRYIDFGGGIGVLNVGHRNPRVMKRVKEALGKFMHSCFQVTPYEGYIELAERLAKLAPGPTPKKVAFFNSGAEAVENAVKIARAATGRTGVIAFEAGFHGRTMMTMALTGKTDPYKKKFKVQIPGVYHVPFPNAYRGVSEEDSFKAIKARFKSDIEASDVAAIIIEPVQGEGGFTVASPAFMQKLRALCDEHGILLICDEVQSGIGRTGKMFASEHAGIEPDLITTAKSLGGGTVISGVIGKAAIMDAPEAGGIGGTYGGNPIACAASLGSLDAIEQDHLLPRADLIADRLRARLGEMSESLPVIGDIRGLGAMMAIELVKDPATKEPFGALAKDVVGRGRDNGLTLLACGPDANVIRFLMPLTIAEKTLNEGLDILEKTIKESLAVVS